MASLKSEEISFPLTDLGLRSQHTMESKEECTTPSTTFFKKADQKILMHRTQHATCRKQRLVILLHKYFVNHRECGI